MTYGFDAFIVATIIAIIIWRIVLGMMTRTLVRSRCLGDVLVKNVTRPTRDELRLVSNIITVALFATFVIIAAFYYPQPVANNFLEGFLQRVPRYLTAAVLIVLFDGMTASAGPKMVRRLARENEDDLRAEYLRMSEKKARGEEVDSVEYRIGGRIYKV